MSKSEPLWNRSSLPLFALGFVAACFVIDSVSNLPVNLAVVSAAICLRSRSLLGAVAAGAFGAVCAVWLAASAPTAFVHAVGESRQAGELQAVVVSGPLPYPRDRCAYRVDLHSWDSATVQGRARLVGDCGLLPGDIFSAWTRVERPPRAAFAGASGMRHSMGRRGVWLTGSIREDPLVVGRQFSAWRPLARLKLAHIRSLESELSGDRAGHAIALTTGHKAFLSDEVSEVWNVSGTGHLLAISGLHFGLIGLALWSIGRWLAGSFPIVVRRWGARRVAAPFVAFGLILALLWVGGPTSARRAFVLAVGAAVALGALRRASPVHLFAFSAMAVAAVDPPVVRELGYQLSFLATGSIIAVLWGPLARHPADEAPGWRERGLQFVVISTAASLATAPALGFHLGAVPVGGFWANLWAIPVVASIVFPLAVIGSFVAAVSPEFGYTIVDMAMWILDVLAVTVGWAAGPETLWVTGRWPLGVSVVFVAIVATVCAVRDQRINAGAAAILVALSLVFEASLSPVEQIEVHAIPVGQGDATLVRFPDGANMLIDAGGSTHGRDPGSRVVVPYLRRVGVRRLDHVVVTHPDLDHIGGLAAVARNVAIGAIVRDGCVLDDKVVAALARAEAVHLTTCSGFEWGATWRVRVVRPDVVSDSKNDRSLVVEVTWNGARVLMTGDAEIPAETWWARNRGRQATVLKLGHHGSKTSTTPELLRQVSPSLAFVSAGRFSRFGHPDEDVVARVERTGAALASTARDGVVIYQLSEKGEVTWRAVRAPPLVDQASIMRKTQSMGSSSRSGETVSIPKSPTSASTNL